MVPCQLHCTCTFRPLHYNFDYSVWLCGITPSVVLPGGVDAGSQSFDRYGKSTCQPALDQPSKWGIVGMTKPFLRRCKVTTQCIGEGGLSVLLARIGV